MPCRPRCGHIRLPTCSLLPVLLQFSLLFFGVFLNLLVDQVTRFKDNRDEVLMKLEDLFDSSDAAETLYSVLLDFLQAMAGM